MGFKPSYRSRLLVGDFSLSCKSNDATVGVDIDMLDPTTFCDEAKRSLPGLSTSTLSVGGFIDLATATDTTAWDSAQPFTFGAEGLAAGAPVLLVNALRASYELGSPVGDMSSFSIEGQTDGTTDFGVSLHDLTAETDDASGSSVDNGAATANGGVAHLHVTDLTGLDQAVIIVEDSANNSAWATIATFATVTGVTVERVELPAAVRRYLRCSVDVTGNGSITFHVSAARR